MKKQHIQRTSGLTSYVLSDCLAIAIEKLYDEVSMKCIKLRLLTLGDLFTTEGCFDFWKYKVTDLHTKNNFTNLKAVWLQLQ